MSTKIYFAYRMPTKVFSTTFLSAFRKHVFKAASDHVNKMAGAVTEADLKAAFKASGNKSKFADFMKEHEDSFRLRVVFQRIVEASKSKARDFDCIDCSLNVWLHAGKVYAILYGEHWLWDKFKPPALVEDYCYWNNTDEPENVTGRQWQARGKTWDKVCLDGGWDDKRMVHEVINASQGIGLFQVAEILVGKDKAYAATWLH